MVFFHAILISIVSNRVKPMNLYTQLLSYQPYNEQEEADRSIMLDALLRYDDLYDRSNLVLHLTASSWITNPGRNQILMIYHNIYHSWAWTGGHADGDRNLLAVAIREAEEETGLLSVRPVSDQLFSIETLTVNPHVKRGKYVPAHLHLNVTYLLEADDHESLKVKPDENSDVRWFSLDGAVEACSEPWMWPVYRKLNEKLEALCKN